MLFSPQNPMGSFQLQSVISMSSTRTASAVFMPIDATVICCYFTLRCGGKTLITFLFDSCFSWVVCIPIAWILLHYTNFNIVMMYAAVVSAGLLKLIIGLILVSKKLWVNNLVESEQH